MKFLAFGASTSKASINKRFVAYIGTYFEGTEVIDLNDFELPVYSIDLEEESGIPENVIRFYDKLSAADIIIISLAEHNGTYTAAFKNLFDWTSRYKSKLFESKRLILAATSPGQRGGKGVMMQLYYDSLYMVLIFWDIFVFQNFKKIITRMKALQIRSFKRSSHNS